MQPLRFHLDSNDKQKSLGADLPFGAMGPDDAAVGTQGGDKSSRKDWRKQENRRGSARRGGRKRPSDGDAEDEPKDSPKESNRDSERAQSGSGEESTSRSTRNSRPARGRRTSKAGRTRHAPAKDDSGEKVAEPGSDLRRGRGRGARQSEEEGSGENRSRLRNPQRGGRSSRGRGQGTARSGNRKDNAGAKDENRRPARRSRYSKGGHQEGQSGSREKDTQVREVTGMVMKDKKSASGAALRLEKNEYLPHKDDIQIPQRLMVRYKLREGSMVKGRLAPSRAGQRKVLGDVETVDDQDPKHWASNREFKALTSIDPDFHYAMGDETDDVALRILDLICPIGRGTRGLIVAPPRSGKSVLMQKIANAIEKVYPDVHLMVLLVDERPEEATEWKRNCGGQVFVSTNDEPLKRHVQTAEICWKRCQRLVEMGEDVILLMDSITRLARAYNNTVGAGSGRTMSGGLDSAAMTRPKQFFGSARNTETAGSLTILGTTLVDTGSRMDQVIFEEFKGTGNMELVLSRKLADRRVFPAVDIERSGTRKEEKLISSHRLRQINTLRRVLARMHYLEAMELLVTKLEEVERTDDFLQRFEVDPEA